jgi:hypothetical protein
LFAITEERDGNEWTAGFSLGMETWQAWSDRVGFFWQKMPVQEARKEFEALVAAWNNQFEAKGRLPWPP